MGKVALGRIADQIQVEASPRRGWDEIVPYIAD
jgi:hypothetical protein